MGGLISQHVTPDKTTDLVWLMKTIKVPVVEFVVLFDDVKCDAGGKDKAVPCNDNADNKDNSNDNNPDDADDLSGDDVHHDDSVVDEGGDGDCEEGNVVEESEGEKLE